MISEVAEGIKEVEDTDPVKVVQETAEESSEQLQ